MAGNASGTERARAQAQVGATPGAAEQIMLEAAAKASAENFPVAMRILPARYRRHLMALYGFARLTDDAGDEITPAARFQLLDDIEADVARIYGGDSAPRLAALRELAATVAECGIPAQPLVDLIQANRQDQIVTRYQTFTDLAGYCRLSANPVGRVVLHIFGAVSAERERLSDNICTALQLVEHWQDVAEDLRKGRIYLPRQDMEQFGVTEEDLAASMTGPRVRALIGYETARASALLDEGAPLVGTLRGWGRLAVAGYLAGGRAALSAMTRSGHDVLGMTPRPGKRETAAGAIRAYLRGR
jgi:squalene synthase HpnC